MKLAFTLALIPILVAAPVLAQQGARAIAPANAVVAPAPPAECASVAIAVSELPDDVDLVVVVERCTELRASPWGDAVAKFLGDAGAMSELGKAWDGLAEQLGWTRAEAFDRLLGQRVVLVSKGEREGQDRRWALMSDVSVETERRLKERLQASPRAIVEGHQILALENGGYELASHHSAPAPGKAGKPVAKGAPAERVTLVLGPMGKGELFDELLGSLTRSPAKANPPGAALQPGAPGTMGSHDVFKQACEAGGMSGAEVLVLAALDGGEKAERWGDFVMLAGQRVRPDPNAPAGGVVAAAAWHSRVVVRQQARREALLRMEPTSDAAFRGLSSDSALAIVQNAPLPDVIGPWAWKLGTIGQMLPLPDDVKKAMTARQALVCRVVEPDARVSCTFAMHSDDTGELARTLDSPIAAWISRVEKQLGYVSPPVADYGGLAPGAVRVSPVGGAPAGGPENGVPLLSSKPLTVSWAYPSRPAEARGEQRPGWWTVNVSQRAPVGAGAPNPAPPAPPANAAELLTKDIDALIGDGHGGDAETARWVWLASARPRALEAMLPAVVLDYQGFRSAMRRMDRVDLWLRITDVGDIQGDLDVRLTPAGE